MMQRLKGVVNRVAGAFGARVCKKTTFQALLARVAELEQLKHQHATPYDVNNSPLANFTHPATLSLTKRRQEHLSSLNLDVAGKTVLEVGAGIGDHTSFFLDRGCKVLATEGRPENVAVFRERYLALWGWYKNIHNLEIAQLDVENPPASFNRTFDIVYCYGLLYHVREPLPVLKFLAKCSRSLLLLETSVSYGAELKVVRGREDDRNVSQSIHGHGCHPSRPWIYQQLKEEFPFVYLPLTQPSHDQFPLDWTRDVDVAALRIAQRAVFVASRQQLDNALLVEGVPPKQRWAS